jgi:SAM-dependent methyltransferase
MSDTAFVGQIPMLYDDLLGPMLFEPYANDLAARLRDVDGAVLETAAGTGRVTRALARTLPASAKIHATDLNPEMIAFASKRTDAPNVSWKQADAQALPFEDGAFRAGVCSFGMMFLPDKPKGYREAARVLAPGGRFLFAIWGRLDKNDLSHAIHETVAKMFPNDPPSFLGRTPFGYADEARIRKDAGDAFRRLDFETVEHVTRTTAAKLAVGLCKGCPLRGEIEARGDLDEVTKRVEAQFIERYGAGEIDNPMSAIVVTALV